MSLPSSPRAAAWAAGLALAIADCGSARSGPTPAGPSSPSAASPLSVSGDAWPALLHGPSHYGAAVVAGPTSAHIRWQLQLGGPAVPGAVISAADIAYAASNGGALHAIDVGAGRELWSFNGGAEYGSDLSTSPLLLGGGEVIWPGPRHRLFGLEGRGRLRWTVRTPGDPLTPVIDPVGDVLVVADATGAISGYRLGRTFATPRLLWTRRLASVSNGNPAVAGDGTIYETAGDSLYALSPAGPVRWTLRTPAQVEVSAAIAENGIVVFGSDNRDEYGVDPSGRLRWRLPIGNFTYSSPLALAGRKVVFGNHSGHLKTVDSDTGRLIQLDQGRGQIWTAAAVDARGDVYFATRDGLIYGFDPAGRRLFAFDAGSPLDGYPALAPDGTLLIGSVAGTLYAIGG